MRTNHTSTAPSGIIIERAGKGKAAETKVVNSHYLKRRDEFVAAIEDARSAKIRAIDSSAKGYFVRVLERRRFDVVEGGPIFKSDGETTAKVETLFFIDKENGNAIYGPRSDYAVNENHYFGTLDEARKWEWGNTVEDEDGKTHFWPAPKSRYRKEFKAVKQYGNYTLYERVA